MVLKASALPELTQATMPTRKLLRVMGEGIEHVLQAPVHEVPSNRTSWLVAPAARMELTAACSIFATTPASMPHGSLMRSKMTFLLFLNTVARLNQNVAKSSALVMIAPSACSRQPSRAYKSTKTVCSL
jgi:hypothetical protein